VGPLARPVDLDGDQRQSFVEPRRERVDLVGRPVVSLGIPGVVPGFVERCDRIPGFDRVSLQP
jgi:hypothetical protein